MLRILHTADWQIGRTYSGFPADDAVPMAEARFAAVERIAQMAQREAVDIVVVAGDVFDSQTVSERTIRRLFNALSGFAGPWLMIPGNHDAALTESVWTQAQRLGVVPANVHAVLTPGAIDFQQLRLSVLCAPLTQRHTHSDLTDWFDRHESPEAWYRVGVAHGAVQGVLPEGIDSANPIASDRVSRACLDYLALGDWHGTRRIDERTWYAGTPEPDRFKANDSGQVLLVEIEAPGSGAQLISPDIRSTLRVSPIPVAQFRWSQRQVRLEVSSDLDALEVELARLEAPDVFELAVDGQIDLAGRARLNVALAAAAARVRSLRTDLGGLRLAPTADDIAALRADGYLGELITELRAGGDATDPAEAERARDTLALLTAVLSERVTASAPAVGAGATA